MWNGISIVFSIIMLAISIGITIGIAALIIKIGAKIVIKEVKKEFFAEENERYWQKDQARYEWEQWKAEREREAARQQYRADHPDDYERWKAEHAKNNT